MSDPVRPHRWQPTRLPHPWDSPGKNTGVGCHFLLQCRKVKSESEVAQSCPTLRDTMDCSPPGSSVHGIFQARGLEWGATAFSYRIIHVHIKTKFLRCCVPPAESKVFLEESFFFYRAGSTSPAGTDRHKAISRSRDLLSLPPAQDNTSHLLREHAVTSVHLPHSRSYDPV